MNKNIKKIEPCACGSVEFVSQPNSYDLYELIDGKLELQKSLPVYAEDKLFCRECGEELNDVST